MAIVEIFGHRELRARLQESWRRNALPSVLLLQGPRGVGKQRLALWLAQMLLCEEQSKAPCGACKGCRFSLGLRHPDLHWYFPRPRLKDSDPDLEDVREDYAEAVAERASDDGLYAPPSGMEGIFIATVRHIVQRAVLSPAIARRKVFIVGDADRMVPQEGSEQAANAFLKLLEEPAPDTFIVLTSSEAGSLLPTVRSRVVSIRVAPLSQSDVHAFLTDERVAARLDEDENLPREAAERIVLAAGAPGRLLAGATWTQAIANARLLLDAIRKSGAGRYEAAWAQGGSKARGTFTDTLDALTVALHEQARSSANRGADRAAVGYSRAMEAVEVAKERAANNVSPQLISANLLREFQEMLS